MKRLDLALVELGLVPSRRKAQDLIAAGEVEVLVRGEWTRVTQASHPLKDVSRASVRLNAAADLLKYVSRGGLKLEGALAQVRLDVSGWRVVDAGLSTGGFTDCLLQHGCREVVGFDVGHDQLAAKLRVDPRVMSFEGVNVRALGEHAELRALLSRDVDLCVVDVSFISLTLVLPPLLAALPAGVRLLALVKPQFEVGAAALDKNGVLRDERLWADVQAQILRTLEKCGFSVKDYFPSTVKGQDGNQEFFVYAQGS